jgi:hypothetical protein
MVQPIPHVPIYFAYIILNPDRTRRCMNGPSSSRLCPAWWILNLLIMLSLCSPPFVRQSPPLSYKFAAITNVGLAPNVNINVVLVTQVLES